MKIIASDYDGTLSYGGIDDKKREAIRKWRDAGNIFAIVSGRGPADALKIQEKDKLDIDYFVATNGSIILNSKGKRVSDIKCSGDTALPLIRTLFECGCPWGYVQTDFPCRIYADKSNCAEIGEYTFRNNNSICLKYNISRTVGHFSLCHTRVCLQRRNSRLHATYCISDAKQF